VASVAEQAAPQVKRRRYFPVRIKFAIAVAVALAWTMLSVWLSQVWVDELGAATHPLFALFAITFIAYVPGFMNAFLVTTLLLDRRPRRHVLSEYPGVTVLIAAYNEADAIADTIDSAAHEEYPGPLEILVLNDGSKDNTSPSLRRPSATCGPCRTSPSGSSTTR
jgi:biofilm PGA synthesis N-glycosyltransferase PgaC